MRLHDLETRTRASLVLIAREGVLAPIALVVIRLGTNGSNGLMV